MLNDCLYCIISVSIFVIFRFLLFLASFWSWTTPFYFCIHRRLFFFFCILSSLRNNKSNCWCCNTRRILLTLSLLPRRCWWSLMNHLSCLYRHWYLWCLNLNLWFRPLSRWRSLSRYLFRVKLLLLRLLDRHH